MKISDASGAKSAVLVAVACTLLVAVACTFLVAVAGILLAVTPARRAVAQEAAAVRVLIETELGEIEVELDASRAPVTVENFLRRVDAGRYDGGRFHRAVRLDNQVRDDVLIEVIQGGGNPEMRSPQFAPIPLERTRDTGLLHVDGALSMARGSGADTASSDFFICIGDQPSLDFGGTRAADGQGFAAFGRVLRGMEVVRKIHQSPTERENLAPPVTIVRMSRID